MKLFRVAYRSISDGFHHHQLNRSMIVRTLSTNLDLGHDKDENANSLESTEDLESRMFDGHSDEKSNAFFRALDKGDWGASSTNGGQHFFGSGNGFSSLLDGYEGRLKEAAKYFEFDPAEINQDDYAFRSDMNLRAGTTYTTEDLNLKKPGFWKPSKRPEFQVTSEEVLKKADFRNVRFLANFLTEAGIIIKRSKTGISAKAQRKVAREIKIARAFGLLPFTTMGTKQFVFGRTMEDLDGDYVLDEYGSRVAAEDFQDPIAD